MGVSGISGAEGARSATPMFAWQQRWDRSPPDVTDGPVRRVAPTADTTPGAGRGTGPPGPPITTTLVPDLGADGTPPLARQPDNEDNQAIQYGAGGRLSLSSGLQLTLFDRRV